MIVVNVELDYGWPMSPDEQFVRFVVDGRNPMDVHERFGAALASSERYLELVDVDNNVWPFHIETVRRVVTRVCGTPGS